MKTLEIDMENCFGISKFEHKFDFADDTCVLIYAPQWNDEKFICPYIRVYFKR